MRIRLQSGPLWGMIRKSGLDGACGAGLIVRIYFSGMETSVYFGLSGNGFRPFFRRMKVWWNSEHLAKWFGKRIVSKSEYPDFWVLKFHGQHYCD